MLIVEQTQGGWDRRITFLITQRRENSNSIPRRVEKKTEKTIDRGGEKTLRKRERERKKKSIAV